MNSYLLKQSFCPSQISEPPDSKVGIIAVIPCFNEPDLISSLESLRNCERPDCYVEVIVVINAAEDSPEEINYQNEKTFSETKKWIEKHTDESLKFFLIKNCSLPKKHAGVGLARKIGMDEAIFRFEAINNRKGIIVCFDADSTCDKNYWIEIQNHFKKKTETPACSIYFEHPVNKIPKEFQTHSGLIKEGIIQYELFLRYYRQGLKFAGHPAAFHTIGSSMAVRADIYCKQGGMNKRKAGEDFYFLQKIIPLGNFTEINSTRVIPSPRPSLRVPFGTGKTISEFVKKGQKEILAYHPQTFVDLKNFIDKIKKFNSEGEVNIQRSIEFFSKIPDPINKFLLKNNFEKKLKEIIENTSSGQMFIKRFFRWFDGFLVLKFVHFARDNFYKDIPVSEAAKQLLHLNNLFGETIFVPASELLDIYRNLDRNN